MAKQQSTLTRLWKIDVPHETPDPNETPCPTTKTDDSASTSEGKGQSSSKKTVKKFQSSWLSQFSWLRYDDNDKTMHCLTCENANNKSPFAQGTTNYQKSALFRHETSDDHILAMKTLKQRRYMEAAQKCVDSKLQPVLEAQLRTALWMAKENVADRKFLSLIDLQIANTHLLSGSASGSASGSVERPKGIRTHHQAASDMQGYLATVLKEMMVVRLQNSPYIGIMLDESLDIATKKKLVIFARIIHNGTVRNEFCANVEVQDGKAETIYSSLVDFLASVGVDMQKVSGFGTDGASVMTGRHSGVGVKMESTNPRIIHVWCAAHRTALVSYWAAKKVPYLQQVQRTLVNIYTFYQFSAPRYNKLRELCKIMGEKVKKFKKPTQVRWLSLQDAVLAVLSGWSALVLGLEHEVANNPQSEGGNKAKSLLREVKSFKFISAICLLKDVLDNLCSLSKKFQKEVVDIEQVTSLVASSKETLSVYEQGINPPTVSDLINCLEESDAFQGIDISCFLRDRLVFASLKRKFIANIVDEFDKRFSADDMSVLKDLNAILNPKLLPEDRRNLANYGNQYLDFICDFFADIIDTERARRSFLQFKFFANQHRNKSLIEFCSMVATEYIEEFRDFSKLAAIFATVPLTSVPCERGFSVQNRHLNRFTNRRGLKQVENRMIIAYASSQPDYDESTVVNKAMDLAMKQ